MTKRTILRLTTGIVCILIMFGAFSPILIAQDNLIGKSKNQQQIMISDTGEKTLFAVNTSKSNSPAIVDDSLRKKESSVNKKLQDSAEDDAVEIAYTFSNPTLKSIQINGSVYTRVELQDAPTGGTAGSPLLPEYRVKILIPYGKTVRGIIAAPEEETLLTIDSLVEPAGTPIPISWADAAPVIQPDMTIYSSSTPFPVNILMSSQTYMCRGFTTLYCRLSPVQYIPAEGLLRCYHRITVKVQTIDTDVSSNSLYRGLSQDKEEVMRDVDNPEMCTTYPDSKAAGPRIQYSLLIITTPELATGFEPLVAAHNAEGVATMVKTLGEDIPVSDEVNVTCENIRSFIREMYTCYGIDYVLLGGDIDVVPAAFLYYGQASQFGYIFNVTGPSDIYYACLDGSFNWDGDSFWGEPYDGGPGYTSVDLLAEVYVGRACVGNISEVGYFVNKTLTYMNSDNQEDYLKEVLMVGQILEDEGEPTWGCDYMDELIDGASDNGYNTVGIPSSLFTVRTLYDRDWEINGWPYPHGAPPSFGGWPRTLLINQINNGTHIINNLGHASSVSNMKLWIAHFANNLNQLTNNEPCFIYSQGCDAGAFDWDYNLFGEEVYDCIAEHFTIKTMHGAFAGIWNSRYGWYMPGSTNGPSQRYHREFWDAVFGENLSVISEANQDSKEDNLYLIDNACMRWCYYEINYFGDPALTFKEPFSVDAHGPYESIPNTPVQFVGTVVGGTPPYSWLWNFGDGHISTDQNTTHNYSHVGNYPVKLKVVDSHGMTDINVTQAIIKSLQADANGPYQSTVGEPIQFVGLVIGGVPPYNWSWDFGDSENATMQNPVHTYHEEGIFTVILNITDSLENSDTDTTRVTVHSIIFVDDDSPLAAWYDEMHVHTIQEGIDNASEGSMVYVYNGTYYENVYIAKTITLVGENRTTTIIDGDRTDDVIMIAAGADNVVIRGFTIQHSGTVWGDAGIDILSNYNNITENIVQDNYINIFLSGASYTAIRKNCITDACTYHGIRGQDASHNIICENTISNNHHTGIRLTDSSNDNRIYRNYFINNLQGNAYDACTNIWDNEYPDGGNYWSDFDEPAEGAFDAFQGEDQNIDGADGIVDLGLPNGGLNPYSIPGGDISQDRYPLLYIPQALSANANGPYFGIVNESIQFTGFASGGTYVYTWYWDFGDGNTSTEQNPLHEYRITGAYPVILTVIDSEGETNTDTTNATIYFMIADAHGPYSGMIHQPVNFIGSVRGGSPNYTWWWDFGDGNTSNDQNTSRVYENTGTYPITLRVNDSQGHSAYNTTIAIITTDLIEHRIYYYHSSDYLVFYEEHMTWEAAIRITPEELAEYSVASLVAGRFYHYNYNIENESSNPHCGYLKIYDQGSTTHPGPLLASVAYVADETEWIRIDLSTPLFLNLTRDIWISIEITTDAYDCPFVLDDGPVISSKGGFIKFSSYDWYEQDCGNWNIEAIVLEGELR